MIFIKTYNIIDLFAGAGGLSLGFRQTDRINIVAAAELNPHARKTYKRNFKSTCLYEDVCKIDYAELKDELGPIDIVIGGPPCQGFSNANRQRTSLINMNNRLVKEYVHAIYALQPTAFVMENVAALRSKVHRFLVDKTDLHNEYIMAMNLRDESLEILPAKGSFDGVLALIRGSNDSYFWEEPFYKAIYTLYRFRKNQEKFDTSLQKHRRALLPHLKRLTEMEATGEIPVPLRAKDTAFAEGLLAYMEQQIDFSTMIRHMEISVLLQQSFLKLRELAQNNIHIFDYREEKGGIVVAVKSYAVLDYIKTMLSIAPHKYTLYEHTLNALHYGAPQKRERFILIGLSEGCKEGYTPPTTYFGESTYRTVRDAIGDLQEIAPSIDVHADSVKLLPQKGGSVLAKNLRGARLYNHVAPATGDIALARFHALREGQNFHDLNASLKTTYTDTARTQNTIYMRLCYDEPCGTVVNVRKSMWIHPVLDRAISIREAARLQTFPDSFVFEGTKDAQYQQVGNAVPPFLAKAIAKSLIRILDTGTNE
ncbi:C-5 cytosine-specific family DNA methylase [Centipeda periodontii DSM 2778]|uniref:Cytosine-specific methyltransferase n=1 Tax=Centipeda periodontii DSM 2778 TaxID=888060 RepID=F5RJ60_9FIRM|nr:DNA cytosine methyltransferase [Centipeda periodontii]EGK62046.1 C-5 cytosine-specific family DNA methylase [Centipeda periodontii DSM 2778]